MTTDIDTGRSDSLLDWLTGGVLDSDATWREYRAADPDWLTTARALSLPMLAAGGLVALLLTWLFSDYGRPFYAFLGAIIPSLIWFGLGGVIASFLAARFGGEESFSRAWAALTFAAIPAVLGNALSPLPLVGWLLALAGAIWGLVMLYNALPVFLGVPEDRRLGHFLATMGLSIVGLIVAYALLGAIGLGALFGGGDRDLPSEDWREQVEQRVEEELARERSRSDADDDRSVSASEAEGGMFGFGRELSYLGDAGDDAFAPPSDGKVTEEQVRRVVHFLQAAQTLRDESGAALEKLNEDGDEASLGDIFKGIKGAISAGTAEMQAVKSGNGNWAEHEWVKQQLFGARLHKDLDATTSHNYELYQRYEDELADLL
ncbi:MAG: Yip1 family protein [Pseudomonadota bacterium]